MAAHCSVDIFIQNKGGTKSGKYGVKIGGQQNQRKGVTKSHEYGGIFSWRERTITQTYPYMGGGQKTRGSIQTYYKPGCPPW